MSYHYDWITRQIEIIAATLAYLLSGKKAHVVQIDPTLKQSLGENPLYLQLSALVGLGRICEAENLLYEALEQPDQQVLQAALQFYDDLNSLSDDVLENADFSREEILQGLQHICQIYGIPV